MIKDKSPPGAMEFIINEMINKGGFSEESGVKGEE
jgi:hypothetical protein